MAASLNESQVTNAVGALLDITMINEWREAGGRREGGGERRSESNAKTHTEIPMRSTDMYKTTVSQSHFNAT